MRISKESSLVENVVSWIFLISIAFLDINQIISETSLFNVPNYEIYRTFLRLSYFFGLVIIFLHTTQGNTQLTNINFIMFVAMIFITISNVFNDVGINNFFVSTCWCIGFMAGYCFAKHNVFKKFLKTRILLFAGVATFAFISMNQNFSSEYATTNIIGVNYIFYFGFPIFIWFAYKNNFKAELFLSALFIVAAIFSFKRTSFLAILFALVMYYFFKYARQKSLKMQGAFLICFIIFFIVIQIMNNYTDGRLFERFADIGETGGNGRAEIWKMTIEGYKNAPFANKILGSGFNTVKNFTRRNTIGLSAHNDFLEILYDYGIIIFALYVFIVLKIFKAVLFAKKHKPHIFPVFIAVFCLFIVISTFSHIMLYSYVSLPIFYLLGGLYAMTYRKKIVVRERNFINGYIGRLQSR